MGILEFSKEEAALLVQDGYAPGYMMDIEVGDLVAIVPVMRTDFNGRNIPVKTVTVQRIMRLDATYIDSDNKVIPHTVVVFIGIDLDNLPVHCSYGNTYPCFIKKP